MTIPDTKERQQFLVLDYLYGDWGDAQKREFEQMLTVNESLKQLVDDETRFVASFPVGSQPSIVHARLHRTRAPMR